MKPFCLCVTLLWRHSFLNVLLLLLASLLLLPPSTISIHLSLSPALFMFRGIQRERERKTEEGKRERKGTSEGVSSRAERRSLKIACPTQSRRIGGGRGESCMPCCALSPPKEWRGGERGTFPKVCLMGRTGRLLWAHLGCRTMIRSQ